MGSRLSVVVGGRLCEVLAWRGSQAVEGEHVDQFKLIAVKALDPAHIELGFKRGTTKFPGNRFLRDAILLERSDAIRTISARIKAGIERAAK